VIEAHAAEFALWTDDAALAAVAQSAGVDYIGPDLEREGKRARQPDQANLISTHQIECLETLNRVLEPACSFARCNTPEVAVGAEIEALIAGGVRCIMLPMVRAVAQVEVALTQIRGRARLIVMVEHVDVLDRLDALLALKGVHAFYIGTNDLSRSMGHRSRFGAIADGTLQAITAQMQSCAVRFGFLGLAREAPGFVALPVSPSLSLNAMVELGATLFLFARSYYAQADSFAENFGETRRSLSLIANTAHAVRAKRLAEFIARCAQAEQTAARVTTVTTLSINA
jgi:2-keto-3-deoxy-L-rhamnonate aldolase RhmA